jgi:hypothetical protein
MALLVHKACRAHRALLVRWGRVVQWGLLACKVHQVYARAPYLCRLIRYRCQDRRGRVDRKAHRGLQALQDCQARQVRAGQWVRRVHVVHLEKMVSWGCVVQPAPQDRVERMVHRVYLGTTVLQAHRAHAGQWDLQV